MIYILKRFFRSIYFFYFLFVISNALIVIGLSNLAEAENIIEEHHFTIISIIGALMLIASLSVILAPPIIRLKNLFYAFILRKVTAANIATPEISPQRIPHHFTFIENLVIFTTTIGIFFIGILTYVLFNLYFKYIFFVE